MKLLADSITRRARLATVACALAVVALLCTPSTLLAQVRSVTAAWDANQDGLTAGYHVLVGTSPSDPLVVLDVARNTSVALPLPVGGRYYVAVRAYTGSGAVGPPSAEAVVDLRSVPGPPAALNANVSGPTVRLSWTDSSTGGDPLTYLLTAGTSPGSANLLAGVPLGDVNSVSGDLPPGIYYVRVQGANLVGVGPPTDLTFEIGGGYRPQSPSNLRRRWNGSTVTLTWDAPTGDPNSMPTSYLVEAGTAAGASNVGGLNVGNTLSFSVDVPPGTFYVRVRGVNARGVSDPSNEVVVQR